MVENKLKKSEKQKKLLRVTMVRSSCKATKTQIGCLRGLGLRRIGDNKDLEDTPSVRGMVQKVSHLVSMES